MTPGRKTLFFNRFEIPFDLIIDGENGGEGEAALYIARFPITEDGDWDFDRPIPVQTVVDGQPFWVVAESASPGDWEGFFPASIRNRARAVNISTEAEAWKTEGLLTFYKAGPFVALPADSEAPPRSEEETP